MISNVVICDSIDEVNDRISQVEESTFVKYIVHTVDRGFNKEGWKPQFKCKIYWEWMKGKATPRIPYDGIPFMFIGQKLLGCHRGRDKGGRKKEQYVEEREKGNNGRKGKRQLLIKTKKVSCPARFAVTRIAKFPDFMLEHNTMRNRKAKSQAIRQALQVDPSSVFWKIQYLLRVPIISDHEGHPVGKGADDVDDRVKQFIKTKMSQGVTRVREMKNHMVQYVQTELFRESSPPPLRKFFPTEKTVRDIMAKVRAEEHYTKIDLAHLLTLTQDWKKEALKTNFLLRMQSESDNLLLCYQTDWQKGLLQRYGRDVCFLDAAYKRMRFPLPLFFLCVRTNVSLVVVSLFVVQSKSTEALREALEVFKQWNQGWKPVYFLTEYCPIEMQAVETAFTGTQAVFNDYLRERTWTQWLSNRSRGITDQHQVFEMMRAIAGALTKDQYQGAVEQLQNSAIWKQSQLFKNWFTNKWLSEKKRWASAVRADIVNFVSAVNGGLEMQSEIFNYKHLKAHKNDTLSEMLQFVIGVYLPKMLQRHNDQINQLSSEMINITVPHFLWNRPLGVVTRVMDNMDNALRAAGNVEQVSEGTFRVPSVAGQSYTVSFGTVVSLPSCECDAWRDYRLPCEHFCQVFRAVPDWTWEHLCPRYRDHPLLTLHTDPATEMEEALSGILPPDSPPSCSEWDESEVTLPTTPQVPQTQKVPHTPQNPPAPKVLQTLCDREEIQRECVTKLMSMVEDVSRIKDTDHLLELRQKLDILSAQTQTMVAQSACTQLPVSTVGMRKRAGVEIIVAMPKRIKVLSRIDVENV